MENKSEKEPIKVDASSKQLAGTLWRLSYPSMIAMGLQFVYDLVDMAWVGQISKTAISGVTLFTSIYVLFGILNEIAGASSVSMISQNYGRGDMEKTRSPFCIFFFPIKMSYRRLWNTAGSGFFLFR